jgi:phosphatidylserine/phosphatidylglycerophosphate/cardiolipin synthase-like enzyme
MFRSQCPCLLFGVELSPSRSGFNPSFVSSCGRASGIDPLAASGVPVWIDDRARMAHAKTMVIDGAATLQGSYNWTRDAAENSEDLNLISSTVAGACSAHWRQRLAVSAPYDVREDWRRASSAEAP